MPKPKTKKMAFDIVAKEMGMGVWTWEAYGHFWTWTESHGRNTHLQIHGQWQAVCHWPKLQEAVIYSLGYALGMEAIKKIAAGSPAQTEGSSND